MPDPSHVLILGCGRSGTSIFGELFEHLSIYTYHSEPYYDDLSTWPFDQPTAVKVPRASAHEASSPGLSFPLPQLLQLVPKPRRIYWQVRHPLDTICSLQVGISRNWGHHPRPPLWRSWLARPLLEQCAYHWNYLNSVGYQQVAEMVTISRFEDMLADPQAFARRIVVECGLEPEAYSQELAAWALRVQNTNNKDFIEARTSRPYSTKDHTVRVGRWKENLSSEQISQIMPILQETMQSFAYQRL